MRISDWSSDVCSSDLKLEDGHIEDAEAFVFRVAANLLADRGSRMATRGGVPLPLEGSEAMVSGVARECVADRSPERVLLGQDALQQVLAALAELNYSTRDLYIPLRLEKIRQRESASHSDIRQSTLETEITIDKA